MNVAIYLEMICMMVNNQKSFILNENFKMREIYQNIIDQIFEISIRKDKFLKIEQKYMNVIEKVINLMENFDFNDCILFL